MSEEKARNLKKKSSVSGGMQDYMYRFASGYEVLIEMSCCKYPLASELENLWQLNKDALINYLFAVHMGNDKCLFLYWKAILFKRYKAWGKMYLVH